MPVHGGGGGGGGSSLSVGSVGSEVPATDFYAQSLQVHDLEAVADLISSPGSGTWENSAKASAAAVTGGKIVVDHADSASDWFTSTATCWRYGWSVDLVTGRAEVAARVAMPNAAADGANYNGGGVALWNPASPNATGFSRVGFIYDNGWKYAHTTNATTVAVTASEALAIAGAWFKVVWAAGKVSAYYNPDDGAAYPETGWVALGAQYSYFATLPQITAGIYGLRVLTGVPQMEFDGLRIVSPQLVKVT